MLDIISCVNCGLCVLGSLLWLRLIAFYVEVHWITLMDRLGW